MPAGLDNLKHIVVLMMENRSFDHMLGSLTAVNPAIDGLTGNETNPDASPAGNPVPVLAQAEYQSQLQPDPDHHFPAVDLQIFGGDTSQNRQPTMNGFVKSYFNQQQDANHAAKIMYYFKQDDLPVLTTLALEFAVFNRWFASIPGPTICNRAFAHYGTSFGRVDMNILYELEPVKSIYERMIAAPNHSAKLYYYDTASSTMEVTNLLQNQPALFGVYQDFLNDCDNNRLPDYCFIEPNYNDHGTPGGAEVANDQHPDHDVRAGEVLMGQIYNKIRGNPQLWPNTALLILYDEHGGIYDHVPPPSCTQDFKQASASDTETGMAFNFDRLGVRVPAILVSPWIQKGTVVNRVFDHASIPATVTKFFLGDYSATRSPRELSADVFVEPNVAPVDPTRNLLSLDVMRDDCPEGFDV
jgi:phospholipase C